MSGLLPTRKDELILIIDSFKSKRKEPHPRGVLMQRIATRDFMLEDYLPEFQEYFMDKKIKKIEKKEKSVLKDTKELLKMDKKNDKIVDKAKKMKEKC